MWKKHCVASCRACLYDVDRESIHSHEVSFARPHGVFTGSRLAKLKFPEHFSLHLLTQLINNFLTQINVVVFILRLQNLFYILNQFPAPALWNRLKCVLPNLRLFGIYTGSDFSGNFHILEFCCRRTCTPSYFIVVMQK